MNFNSLKEIIDYFELDVDQNNINEIRSALIHLLAESHPDKSGGEFESEKDKEKYNKIQTAINDLDTLNSHQTALVNINQVTEIIKAVTDAIVPRKEEEKSDIEFRLKSELKREIKSSYNPIKISSGTIAGLSTGLITFSKTLGENPIFDPIFRIPNINLILFTILFSSIIWFLFTWFREKRDEQRKEWLFSEDGKLAILTEVLRSSDENSARGKKTIFSFRDFVEVIRGRRERRIRNIIQVYVFTIRRILYGSSRIGISIAEQIARHHLNDLENRNIIKKFEGKSLELLYEIERDLVRQIPDRYYHRYYY